MGSQLQMPLSSDSTRNKEGFSNHQAKMFESLFIRRMCIGRTEIAERWVLFYGSFVSWNSSEGKFYGELVTQKASKIKGRCPVTQKAFKENGKESPMTLGSEFWDFNEPNNGNLHFGFGILAKWNRYSLDSSMKSTYLTSHQGWL